MGHFSPESSPILRWARIPMHETLQVGRSAGAKPHPSESLDDVLADMSTTDVPILEDPPIPHLVDLNKALVFQLVTAFIHQHEPCVALLFGISTEGIRVAVHVNLSGLPLRLWSVTGMPVDKAVNLLGHYEIPAMSWIKLPVGKYSPVKARHTVSLNYCQTEVAIRHEDIIFSATEWIWAPPVSLRILSLSIETAVHRDLELPDHSQRAERPILNIGCIVESEINGDPYRTIFTLECCAPIPGVDVRFFADERTMLASWRDFLLSSDPDLVTGFNIGIFDLNYLILRAEALSIPDFACLGRLKGVRSIARKVPSGQTRVFDDAPILAGRLMLDVCQHLVEQVPAIPPTLDAACRLFVDLHTEDIDLTTVNAGKTEENPRRLAIHCLKNTHLALRLLDRLKCLDKAVRAARHVSVIHLPFHEFLRTGRS